MKQIIQNMGSGETSLVEAPTPQVKSGHLLIRSTASVISVGTERMLVEFGKANLFDKARQQPEKVQMVIDKIQKDGLLTTIDAVRSKLDQPLPLGYSNAGVVIAVGKGVQGFQVGDRVISNGPHASVVRVPQNLCAKIPDNVDDVTASFTVISSIGLQGVRLAQPTLGESFAVFGLGLIGLITVQLLRAHGCRVIGIDFDEKKLELARSFGAETVNLSQGEDPVVAAMAFSRARGIDGVIITASTKSDELISQAAQMSRKRGRIILVGVIGLKLSRADFYEKELTFQVSCSYGPGRYDPEYEEKNHDYPLAFVRWTEQRNFEAVLDMMASGQLDITPLISQRVSFESALEAYEKLQSDRSSLGLVLEYPEVEEKELLKRTVLLREDKEEPLWKKFIASPSKAICGFIGAGNYASRMLIPAFLSAKAKMDTLVTSGGISGVHHGKKAGFRQTSTDLDVIFKNPRINVVTIVTPHQTHARFIVQALQAGKNVFVEKPLALTFDEIEEIDRVYKEARQKDPSLRLMIGFNRRFSPHIVKMKELIDQVKEPKAFIMTINSGFIPADHWTQDPEVGGGRIIGEACHFIDLMRFLAGHPIVDFQVMSMGAHPALEVREDKATISLRFEDGSFGTIHYLANGAKSLQKERIEVFAANATLQLNNFRKMVGFDWPNFKKMNLLAQDKGQNACVKAFISSIEEGTPSPIPYEEIMEVAKVTLEVAEKIRQQIN